MLPFFGQEFSFEDLFSNHKELHSVAKDSSHQVQIIYTQINRDKTNRPSFISYRYQVDDDLYFYPASTVKMPVAFLALQRLNELGIDRDTPLRIGADRFVQTAVRTDTSALSDKPRVAHYIKKIFLVSDNDAYNRLFELLGQNYINSQLHARGFQNSFIKHRLVGGYDGDENQWINPLWFYNKDSVLYERKGIKSTYTFPERNYSRIKRGKGYWNGEEVIQSPFDFSAKNAISLQDLHDQLKAVMFPGFLTHHQPFQLTEKDYAFLYEWMSKLPRNSDSPVYDQPDNYVKNILYGDEEEDFTIPDHIKIFNKPGWAYGFMTDVAYVVDLENGVEFLLAIQLLVNENDIFNDGEYEYEQVGAEFMGKFGKAIYEHELSRYRQYQPNFKSLMTYETDNSPN